MKNKSSEAPQVEAPSRMSDKIKDLCWIAGSALFSAAFVGEYLYRKIYEVPLPPIH